MAFEAGAMHIHSASPVADSYTTGNLILLFRTPLIREVFAIQKASGLYLSRVAFADNSHRSSWCTGKHDVFGAGRRRWL